MNAMSDRQETLAIDVIDEELDRQVSTIEVLHDMCVSSTVLKYLRKARIIPTGDAHFSISDRRSRYTIRRRRTML